MNVEFSGNPKPFGIIGLVLAILSLLFSLIPCIGFYAIIPSAMSMIFCFVALLYMKKNKQSLTVPATGLIIGVMAGWD